MPDLPPLASVVTLARWVSRDPEDPTVVDALYSASARFRSAVRHPVSRVDDDEIWLSPNGGNLLVLPAAPVFAVTEVAVSGSVITDYSWSRRGMLERADGWPEGLDTVRVVYSHGYDPIPDDVTDAVLHHARYLLTWEPGVASMTVGGETVTYATVAGAAADSWDRAVNAYALNHGDRP